MSIDKRWLYAFMCCLWLCAACPDAGLAASSAPDQPRSMYTIQVGSSQNREAAEKEVKRYKSLDLKAFTRHEAVKEKGMWYRIYVGLFATRALAKDFAENLKQQKIISSYWVKAIDPPFPEFPVAPAEKDKPIGPVEKELEAAVETPPPPRIEEPAVSASESPPPPAAIPQEVKSEAVKPEESPSREATQAEVPKTEKMGRMNRFSIGLKGGFSTFSKGGELVLSNSGGGPTQAYSFSSTYTLAGLILSYQLNDRFFLRGSLEKALGSNADYHQYIIDTGVLFNPLGPITPFASVGLIYGELKWDEFVGDIDSGLGWKIGLGGSMPIQNFQLGAEVSYQALDFKYNLPSEWSVANGPDSIDYSGISIAVMVMYRF